MPECQHRREEAEPRLTPFLSSHIPLILVLSIPLISYPHLLLLISDRQENTLGKKYWQDCRNAPIVYHNTTCIDQMPGHTQVKTNNLPVLDIIVTGLRGGQGKIAWSHNVKGSQNEAQHLNSGRLTEGIRQLNIGKSKIKSALPLIGLIILTILSYLNSFDCAFHFDDRYQILNNPNIRDIGKLPDMLSQPFSRPIYKASFAINYYISGFDVWGYHLTNLLFHLIAGILVFQLTRFFLKDHVSGKAELNMASFTGAALFCLHPVQTGAVTYISSRSSVMLAVFYLLAVLTFLRFGKGRKGYLALSLISFVIGFGVKETMVSLPFMLVVMVSLLEDVTGGKTRFKRGALLISPYLLILLTYLLGRKLWTSGVVPSDQRIYEGVLTPFEYLLTEITVIAFRYLRWILLPLDGPHVDPDVPAETTLLRLPVIAGGAVLLSLVITAILLRKRHPPITAGILWFFITLLPTSSIFPVGDLAVERRLYLPLAGVAIVTGYIFLLFWQKKRRLTLISCAAIVLLAFSVLTLQRNEIWETEISLWEDAARKSPHKVRVLNNRAYAYLEAGKLSRAETLYKKLIDEFPDYPFGYNNLGSVYMKTGRINDAVAVFRKAVMLMPNKRLFRLQLARALEQSGRLKEAIYEYRFAARIYPPSAQAFTLLASALARAEHFREAEEASKMAVSLDSNNPLAYYILGYSLEMMGKMGNAISAYEKAISLKPGWAPPVGRLNGLLRKEG
ncbi:MAG: tetratricopeptide repeat protein [Nitrospirae bacterium]|nr:MAG: tetratricopeptide repeat protein [Nitrospirota bacterium]